MADDLKNSLLSVCEPSLEAQLRAVRRLRPGDADPVRPVAEKVCRRLT